MVKIKTIALAASSGAIKDFQELNTNISILEKNFRVKKYFSETKNSYLADLDENRAKFLQDAFLDDEADLVLEVRGGYGAIRIVDKIDYSLIKNSNKYFLASSDGSILLASLSKKTNIKCFHSLMLMNGFLDNLDMNIEIIENDIFDISLVPLKKGEMRGNLWGGNLSSVVSMLSAESYIPDSGIILFLEDLNEPLYKIDKMLYEIYRKNELREKIKGIIFGDFYLDNISDFLLEYARLFNVPCAKTEDITHKNNNITIPYNKFLKITI